MQALPAPKRPTRSTPGGRAFFQTLLLSASAPLRACWSLPPGTPSKLSIVWSLLGSHLVRGGGAGAGATGSSIYTKERPTSLLPASTSSWHPAHVPFTQKELLTVHLESCDHMVLLSLLSLNVPCFRKAARGPKGTSYRCHCYLYLRVVSTISP